MKLFLTTKAVLLTLVVVATNAQDDNDNDCFTSTFALFQAQVADERPEDVTKEYTICPDTTIDIGLPANAELTEFAGGDVPLPIVRDNVSIRCGTDGSSSNNCVLKGGLGHILAISNFAPFGIANATIHNLLVQGLTFTGDMQSLPDNSINSFGVGIAAPGENVVLEDCHWKDLTGIVDVYFQSVSVLSLPGDFPPFSSDVTLKDCSFQNIIYAPSGGGLLTVSAQSTTIERSSFTDIRYAGEARDDAIVGCFNEASCTVKDSCFDSILFASTLLLASSNATVDTENLYLGTGGLTVIVGANVTTSPCTLGLAVNTILGNGEFEECISPFDSMECLAPTFDVEEFTLAPVVGMETPVSPAATTEAPSVSPLPVSDGGMDTTMAPATATDGTSVAPVTGTEATEAPAMTTDGATMAPMDDMDTTMAPATATDGTTMVPMTDMETTMVPGMATDGATMAPINDMETTAAPATGTDGSTMSPAKSPMANVPSMPSSPTTTNGDREITSTGSVWMVSVSVGWGIAIYGVSAAVQACAV